jgi:predicted deacylase
LPVLAARGVQTGPTLLVTGGIHGDEYEGPAAIQALFNQVEAAQLCGTLLGLPVANVAAWEARSRVSPADGLDLNRLFHRPAQPGQSQSPSQALAEAIFETFISRCDVSIDLHSGGARLVHLPLAGWYAGGSDEAEQLARGFGPALHPWLVPDVPGVFSYESHRTGKLALGAEWGGGGRLDPVGVESYETGLRRVLVRLGMIAADPGELDTRPPIRGDYQVTKMAGLFIPAVRLGQPVELGELLGLLYDSLGLVISEVRAVRAGLVAALPHLALLRPGDRITYIG